MNSLLKPRTSMHREISSKRRHGPAFIMLLFLLLGGSCSRWNLGDAGPTTTVFRTVTAATSLRVGQKFDLYLESDRLKPEGYTLEYPEKLIPNIHHRIEAGSLIFKNENQAKWTQDLTLRPKITLNLHEYHTLYIEGASQWRCLDTLYGDALNIEMGSVMDHDLWINYNQVSGKCNNLGTLKLSGRGTIFSFSVEAGSKLDAQNMECHDAYFWHFTQRDCFIKPQKQAILSVYNSGNLFIKKQDFYRYEAQVRGSGRIIQQP